MNRRNRRRAFLVESLQRSQARGVADVLIVCGDGLTRLRNAVQAVYPYADVQLCVVHHIRNLTKFVAWKDLMALCAGMRPIYTPPAIEAA